MNDKLQFFQSLPEKIQTLLNKHDLFDLAPGVHFINNHGEVGEFLRIEGDPPVVYYKNKEGEEDNITLDDFIHYRYNCLFEGSEEDLIKSTLDNMLVKENKDEDDNDNMSTEVGFRVDKDRAEELRKDLVRRTMQVEAKYRILEAMYNKKRFELMDISNKFKKQVGRIEKAIYSIELFLGVNEEVIQIQKGEVVDYSTPIYLRQKLLFMDEEVAIVEDNGLDFSNINLFDEWLLKDSNYKKIAPEEKCIVALRVRRTSKDYGDRFLNATLDEENRKTYFLIRNGGCLYRVYATTVVRDRLFPLREELQKLFDEFKNTHWERDKEKIEDRVFTYKKNILVLQGLIERTDIFKPLPFLDFNLFQPQTYGEFIQFVYDDEMLLPSGRLPFLKWRKEINEHIKRGSRVLLINELMWSRKEFRNRYLIYYNEYNVPSQPKTGIYEVDSKKEGRVAYEREIVIDGDDMFEGAYKVDENGKKIVKEEWQDEKFFIRYNPKDTIINYWDRWDDGHERKNNISFFIDKDDDFVLNYDMIDLSDVEFYLESRVDRHDYLVLIPTLKEIRKKRLEELDWERKFVEALRDRMEVEDKEGLERKIWECVEWWKNKVIWKRPISKDDSKAWRMIEAKVRREWE
jgi:hypothetical protein